MNDEPRHSSVIADEVAAVYDSLARTVDTVDGGIEQPSIDGLDLAVPPVAGQLQLPLDLWDSGRKPTRTVPALVAYDRRLEPDDADELRRLLVGLDVLVTMLDEFVDRSDGHSRLQLTVNVAFGSFLSFANLPDDEPAATDAVLQYLVETARIPTVERAVQRELETIDTWERAREAIRFVYAYRARDISVFGRLPALVADIDDRTAERIVSDLETYRAHYLLFDDIRDVLEDVRNGTETPIVWLLRTHDDPDEIVDSFLEIVREFEYAETPYRAQLRELEREPDDVRAELEVAMAEVDAVPDPVKPDRNPR
ncbi:hypothetical protein [Natrinema salsiterrestre]|uniref:Uncharacterized protein n=1 Tax=Natrinema salsiterrestre TaxID=2950540 RepID=A0A9Q4Q180_9EURY|nr:hypothetical protein [Natrinema salsiterrestre]MDF9746924.1 hypothetical protein [Natrinema salsiterrestre]